MDLDINLTGKNNYGVMVAPSMLLLMLLYGKLSGMAITMAMKEAFKLVFAGGFLVGSFYIARTIRSMFLRGVVLVFFWLVTMLSFMFIAIESQKIGGLWSVLLFLSGMVSMNSVLYNSPISRPKLEAWTMVTLSLIAAFLIPLMVFSGINSAPYVFNFMDGFFKGFVLPMVLALAFMIITSLFTAWGVGFPALIGLGICTVLVILMLPVILPFGGAGAIAFQLPLIQQYKALEGVSTSLGKGMWYFGLLCGVGYFLNFMSESIGYMVDILKSGRRRASSVATSVTTQMKKVKKKIDSF